MHALRQVDDRFFVWLDRQSARTSVFANGVCERRVKFFNYFIVVTVSQVVRCRLHFQVDAYRVCRPVRLLVRRANYDVERRLCLVVKRARYAGAVLAGCRNVVRNVECVSFYVNANRTVVFVSGGRYVAVAICDACQGVFRRFALGDGQRIFNGDLAHGGVSTWVRNAYHDGMVARFCFVYFVRGDQAHEFDRYRRRYREVLVRAFVRRGAVIRYHRVAQDGAVGNRFQAVHDVSVLQRYGVRFCIVHYFYSRILCNGYRFAVLARDSQESLEYGRLVINCARAQRQVFLYVRCRFEEVNVGSVHFGDVGVSFDRYDERLFLDSVARNVLFKDANESISSVRFAQPLGVLVVPLLFKRTRAGVVDVSLSFVLGDGLGDGTFANVGRFVVVNVSGAVRPSRWRDQVCQGQGK